MKKQPSNASIAAGQQRNFRFLFYSLLGALAFYALFAGAAWGAAALVFRPAPEPHPGLRDDALKAALRSDWEHRPLSYLSARNHLWNTIDGDGRRAKDTYTGQTIEYFKQPLPNNGAVEHAWPLTRLPRAARADLHHMFAVAGESRAARLNLHYDTVKVAIWARGGSKAGPGARLKPVFEVRPQTRGDIARAIFYIATMYELEIPQREEQTLRRWHREDPPDKAEKARNARIEKLQSSRNPFVDHPKLLDRISRF